MGGTRMPPSLPLRTQPTTRKSPPPDLVYPFQIWIRSYTLTHQKQVKNTFTHEIILLLRILARIFAADRRPGAIPVQVQPTAREAKVRLCCLKMRTEMP